MWEMCQRGCAALPRDLHRLCLVLLRGVQESSCSPPGQDMLRCPESPVSLVLPVPVMQALTPTPSPSGKATAPHRALQVQGMAAFTCHVPSHAMSPQAAHDHSDASSTMQAGEGIQVFKQLLFKASGVNKSSDPSQLVGKDIIAWNHAQKNSKPSFLLPVLAASSQRSATMPSGAYRQNSQGFSWTEFVRRSRGNQQSPDNNSQHLFCWKINIALALHQHV